MKQEARSAIKQAQKWKKENKQEIKVRKEGIEEEELRTHFLLYTSLSSSWNQTSNLVMMK